MEARPRPGVLSADAVPGLRQAGAADLPAARGRVLRQLRGRPLIYMRWKAGEPRRGRPFEPLTSDHPLTMRPCVVCGIRLGNGTRLTLVAVGATSDESMERYLAGRWFDAAALAVHEHCVADMTEPELAELVADLVLVQE